MLLPEADAPVASLPGVGPAGARALSAAGLDQVRDLLLHLPRDYIDLREKRPLAEGVDGDAVNTIVTVIGHEYIGRGRKRTLKIYVRDETAHAALLCFGRNFLARRLAVGTSVRLQASFRHRYGELQSSVFEISSPEDDEERAVLPIYPVPVGLSQAMLRRVTRSAATTGASSLIEPLQPELRGRRELPAVRDAVRMIHVPDHPQEAVIGRRSLAFLELLILQLGALRRRAHREALRRTRTRVKRSLVDAFLARLDFDLTDDQRSSVEDILTDLASPTPMARLLHGDVGSGKTLVSFIAALAVIDGGGQVALMAPTELLARQHARTAHELLAPLGVRVALLAGGIGRAESRATLQALARGDVDLAVGTHALFSERVSFPSLKLVVIDEQHRFGVEQRQALIGKSWQGDVLFMTATPIPRTLALTAFGDMDVSAIHTMPPGRQPIQTHLAVMGNEAKVYEFVRKQIDAGRQAYFVYPLLGESEQLSLKNAEEMAATLAQEVYPDVAIGLIHGRMDEAAKLRVMSDFLAGTVKILVATSVVEVGVDVANATCMVVEHAERFGLAALHQLRGRVGRSSLPSYCFLVYDAQLTEEAKARLKVMKEETDGFRIAEADLVIRGPGELSGIRQAGYLRLEAANLATDGDLLEGARELADEIVSRDPGLLLPEHEQLRRMLAGASG